MFQKRFYEVGFQLLEISDMSRSIIEFTENDSSKCTSRAIRIYLWYPTKDNDAQKMVINDYLELAKTDFCNDKKSEIQCFEPVPLIKGFNSENIDTLKTQNTLAVRNSEFQDNKFPIIVVGQGLYYESPFTHFLLCEFLASHGYVVVSCPLKGTQYRLVNLNVVDLETIVRDMEFSLSEVLKLPIADKKSIGVIGYDLGGMAGMLLAMRNPNVDSFISLDAGILYPHYSGLPINHPNYNLLNLNVPWLHITQSRFCPGGFEKAHPSNTMKQKVVGDNYLLLLNTTNHGAFTSYAMLGIDNQVPGYWENDYLGIEPIYEKVCAYSLDFLNAYLKNDRESKINLSDKLGIQENKESFERVENRNSTITKNQIIDKIIVEGTQSGISSFYKIDKEIKEKLFADEIELNWLGYHFLYWWNRPIEAIKVFEFITELFPESANAYDSLAEAWFITGDKDKAVEYYQKSLELNPGNENAKLKLNSIK